MSCAILRTAKLKSWSAIAGSGAHTYRTIETLNADPARAGLNVTGIGTKGHVVQDVQQRIQAVTQKPRSNAVLALELLLTASPEFFDGKSPAEVKKWAQANARWLKETFGRDNVVHLVLHQDETTPHLVAYVVPEKEGKLNCRAYTGSPVLLQRMQTSYADAMKPFGLDRGLVGSKAKHGTVKHWYAKLNDIADEAGRLAKLMPAPTPPPDVPFWKGQEARQAAGTAWVAGETRERKKLIQAAAKAVLAASVANDQVQSLKQENSRLSVELDATRKTLSEAYQALGLGKEAIAALRTSNTTLVASRLAYTGIVGPKENAIDLLKRVGGFDYGQAVAWLHAEFGMVATGILVSKAAESRDEPRPFTKAENAIKHAVQTQLDALDAERYRVTLISYDDSKKPFLPGKIRGSTEESFYTRDELIDLIPWLRHQNNRGMNILVTPMDDSAYYILLDDSKVSAEDLVKRGFSPCSVQQTSRESQQVIFKVPKTLDRDSVMAMFNELNRKHGDESITGLRHPMRLSGFRNMKPKHLKAGLYPFVKVKLAVNTMCRMCLDLIQKVEKAKLSTYPQPQQQEESFVMKV